jgi:hypothetical protein
MTLAQRNAIPAPATGLLIYQTNSAPGFYYYSGTAWAAVSPKSKGWNLTGNAGTNPSSNFIGTTDTESLRFRVNNLNSGLIDFNTSNTSFGFQALISNGNGNYNTAVGTDALLTNTTGNSNTAIGSYSLLSNSTGFSNSANGADALHNNTTGYYNTAYGAASLFANTTGSNNTASGIKSLYSNITGIYNTAIGSQSLTSNTTGNYNTGIGETTLTSNITGSVNTAIGSESLVSNTAGNYNSAIGADALYYNNTGNSNTAIGINALYLNTNGSGNTANGSAALSNNTTGYSNVAIGTAALYENADRSNLVAVGDSALYNNGVGTSISYAAAGNTAVGSKSLYSNTAGYNNTGNGFNSLYSNTAGEANTAQGAFSSYLNTSGSFNTSAGTGSLYSNTTGSQNIAIGSGALNSNTIGSNNTANGYQALYNNNTGIFNTVGSDNTAIGYQSLFSNQSGSNNTGIGSGTDVSGFFSNTTALGANAITTAANQVRIGDGSVTSIGGYANWTNISDERVKKNIKNNVPGLAFINKLLPVTYNLDLDAADRLVQRSVIKDKEGKPIQPTSEEIAFRKAKEKIIYTGLIAQDVEKAAKAIGYDFSGVDVAKNEKDLYGLRYAEFVMPLVKAVQELSKMNDEKDAKINDLEARLARLEAIITIQQTSAHSQQSTMNFTSASLEQNVPNPFNYSTTINYTLLSTYSSAKIIVVDKSGKTLKEINISGSGKGSLTVDASTLANGAYNYSLYVNGKLVDTKQMFLAK